MSAETITLGCRLNFTESEAIRRIASATGETVIVNSCAVTAEAVRQTRQAIRRARRQHPAAHIIVTGCAAQIDPQRFAAMAEVDRVVGNGAKFDARSYWPDKDIRIVAPDLATTAPPPVAAGYRSRVRSFVAVQTGCDHDCTFCTIPAGRGPSRSLAAGAVIDAIAAELDCGAREIVLTGVDITSYGHDLAPGVTLGTLVEAVLSAVPRLARLRLSSLDSIEIDEPLFELIAGEARLMPHFHLSLQSGDDLVLKRMKRRHSRAQAVRMVERIRTARSDSTIGADLIAGFPTESEEMAANSLQLLDECDIIAAHVFPFSPRPGTPAARMPQLDPHLVRERAARLRAAAAERRNRWLGRLVGQTRPALIENGERGHSDCFAPLRIAGSVRGQSGMARIAARDGDLLIAGWA